MFGTKLKTWMENHIGRPRRKILEEKGKSSQSYGRGKVLESSESLAQSDTGISSGSQQVLTSSTDNREGYCTTTMESDKSGMTHCRTNISLPSPESAYSTGYSSDGASPAGTGPPEYYINIRTGKHYFPSPAPTPTSPHPSQIYSHLSFGDFRHSQNTYLRLQQANVSLTPSLVPNCPKTLYNKKSEGSTIVYKPNHHDASNFSKSPNKKMSQLNSLKFFLKSPRKEKEKLKVDMSKTPVLENKKKISSPGRNKKWYKQPFQKFGYRKTETSEESQIKTEAKKDNFYYEKNVPYLFGKENTASPRQRNRIKTNPWLPTEPTSSQNAQDIQINASFVWPINRSCTNTPLQSRKPNKEKISKKQKLRESELVGNVKQKFTEGLEKPFNRPLPEKPVALDIWTEEKKSNFDPSFTTPEELARAVNLPLSQRPSPASSGISEADLTVKELMGNYREIYAYDKETDILSDSDTTDCEMYVSDSEANNGGDEQDSHDDELDFIDNVSISESDDNVPRNTGKCSYHEINANKNFFLYKCIYRNSRKGLECKKSFRRAQESKLRDEKRRKSTRKSFKNDENREEFGKKVDMKRLLKDNFSGLSFSKIISQKMITKNDESPINDPKQTLRDTCRKDKESEKLKNSIRKNEEFLIDTEADKKYNELMKEVQEIYDYMFNAPTGQGAADLQSLIKERESKKLEESMKNEREEDVDNLPQTTPKPSDVVSRKSPKHLGLKLQVEECSTTEPAKKSSFKAKSSAHSPLDPLGPTFRNFSVFKPKLSLSSSEDSEYVPVSKLNTLADVKVVEKPLESPATPIVPMAFQSVDLGNPVTFYCPQSEPVKRKIYSCSNTYDKLVKRFENQPTLFEDNTSDISLRGHYATRRLSERKPEKELVHFSHGNQGASRPHKEKRVSGEKLLESSLENSKIASPRPVPRRASLSSVSSSPRVSRRETPDEETF